MCLGMPTTSIKITAIMHVHTTEYTGLILSIFLTDLEHALAQLERLINLKRKGNFTIFHVGGAFFS